MSTAVKRDWLKITGAALALPFIIAGSVAVVWVGFLIIASLLAFTGAAPTSREGEVAAVLEHVQQGRDLSGLSYEEVRGSYLCTEDCAGHEAGWQWAQEAGVLGPEECGGHSQSFIEGCEAWAEEQDPATRALF